MTEPSRISTTTPADSREPTGWWSRPCGGREVLRLAVPLIISTATWTAMNFTDRMFLLWYSKDSMAAALPAGMVHFAIICFPLGIASYASTFVAQYHGSGHPHHIGPAVWQGIRFGFYCLPAFLLLVPLSTWIFHISGHQPEIAGLEAVYFQTALFGAGAEVMAAAMATFFSGRGVTWVVMLVDSFASTIHIGLDYAWIFGYCGFPRMGIEGAVWATVVSLWLRVAIYGFLILLPRYRERYCMWSGRGFNLPLFKRLLRFGGPSGLQMSVEIAGFTLFMLLVGNLGKEALAATTLAFSINCLAFVPTLGLGLALSIIVGQQLGRNNPRLAARATWTSLWIAWVYMGAMSLVYIFLPDLILMGHKSGTPPAEFATLRDTTVVLLRFVAAYCMFDAMSVVFAGALKGAGDTRFIMLTSLVLTPMPIVAAWAGIRFLGLGLIWCWIVVTVWVSLIGVIYCLRFLHGRWRQMRVIEPELLVA
jgi:multidrug resistance protein, MATE family